MICRLRRDFLHLSTSLWRKTVNRQAMPDGYE
jgi:hypothetical protein